MQNLRVYTMGKIRKNDWRHDIWTGLRGYSSDRLYRGAQFPNPPLVADGFELAGPYFLSCDHGCAHGESTHGNGGVDTQGHGCIHPDLCGGSSYSRGEVVSLCLEWLRSADVVFAWLDDATAYGTVAEIGYAQGIGLPVCLYTPSRGFADQEDLWFAREMPVTRHLVDGPLHGWLHFKTLNPLVGELRQWLSLTWFERQPEEVRDCLRSGFEASRRGACRTPKDIYLYLRTWCRLPFGVGVEERVVRERTLRLLTNNRDEALLWIVDALHAAGRR